MNILAVSLSSYAAFTRGDVGLFPVEFSLDAYKILFRDGKVLRGLRNSIFYTALGTTVNVLMTILTAYPMSRKEMPFRKTISVFFAFTMFFGGGMIPSFLQIQKLGLYRSIWSLIIPGAMTVYNMIVLRTFFQSIPYDLTEAATIDGANDWQILVRVVLPLSKAAIATIALFYAVGHWNSWFSASIYLTNFELYPLQLVLRDMIFNVLALIETGEVNNQGYTLLQYAALFISMVPMMVLYPFVQKYFVKGVMIGSVKG